MAERNPELGSWAWCRLHYRGRWYAFRAFVAPIFERAGRYVRDKVQP